jgi:uncharacterized protein (TIGR00730 family)
MRRVCVFCGSSPGRHPRYAQAAAALGRELARRQLGLVYGGGAVGLMGVLADAVLAAGGEVIGVIPHALWQREVGHRGVSDLRVVDTMHQRKQALSDLADAFVALPGGIGTLEELFEVWTWGQLGVHRKPSGLLEVGGYYASLLRFLEHAGDEGFLRPHTAELLVVGDEPAALLDRLAAWQPPPVERWIRRGET